MAAVQRSGASPNLDVLTAGPGAISATTHLYTPQLQKLLDIFLTHYDVVLIDTPPMLQIPDARVIGRHVEGTVLVVRSNKTTKDACRAAQYRLNEDGVPLFGVVMNDWNPKFSTGGYYGYYYKSYYESYHGKDAQVAQNEDVA
jgi:Mrp family chromosome partitioning ATPase